MKKLELGKKETNKENSNYDNIDKKEKSKINILNFFLCILFLISIIILLIFNFKEQINKFLKDDKIRTKVFISSITNRDSIERAPTDINNLEYSLSEKTDTSFLLEEPYESLGIIYRDENKVLEKRKVQNREYLFDLKKKRQFSGNLIENLEKKQKKIYYYLNGFLSKYEIYSKNNLIFVKEFYKSGNDRMDIFYKKNKIIKIIEYYDNDLKDNNYRKITNYSDGKKDGEEIYYDKYGYKEIKNYKDGILID